VDGVLTTVAVACDLPREVPESKLGHRIATTTTAVSLILDAAVGAFPPRMLEEMLEAEVLLLEKLSTERDAWHDPLLPTLPPSALASRRAANATAGPISDDLLHRGFADQVRLRPGNTALVGGITLTYAQLDARARLVARELRALGASRERPVAVVMQKGWQQVVAVLGILEAGSFYVPVDANLPIDRIRFLLEDSRAELVVTQPGLDTFLDWPTCTRARVVVADRLPPETPALLREPETSAPVDPDALAYVIYTSGSTGTPKGVAISHRSAVNTVLDINRRFGINRPGSSPRGLLPELRPLRLRHLRNPGGGRRDRPPGRVERPATLGEPHARGRRHGLELGARAHGDARPGPRRSRSAVLSGPPHGPPQW